MTPGVVPVVRYLIVCENVLRDVHDASRYSLVGLLSALRFPAGTSFPLRAPDFCVFLQLTGCRGPASGRVEVALADSEELAHRGADQHLPFGTDPLAVFHLTVRVRQCTFPRTGLYWVRFRYNKEILAQQPLLVRER